MGGTDAKTPSQKSTHPRKELAVIVGSALQQNHYVLQQCFTRVIAVSVQELIIDVPVWGGQNSKCAVYLKETGIIEKRSAEEEGGGDGWGWSWTDK